MSDDHPTHDQAPCVALMMTRRRFLQGATLSAAMAPLLQACEFVEVFDDDVQATASFDLSEPQNAKLAQVGGLGVASAGALKLVLVRADQDTILAFDRYCSHQGLDMADADANPLPAVWDAQQRQLTCRWHSTVFADSGVPVSGPTTLPIRRYRVEFDPASGKGTVFLAGSPQAGGQT